MNFAQPLKPLSLSDDRKSLIVLDQRLLPNKELFLELKTKEEIFEAIQSLKVRGAPALGLAAAYGLCVVMSEYTQNPPMDFFRKSERIIYYFESARPTAVNPTITLNRLRSVMISALSVNNISSETILELMYAEASKIEKEESEAAGKIGESGLSLLKPGWGVLSHCNA
ncbi:MAG: S-methyl-5-thioribose-1-phosphate isomerase, partial [Bacteroidales bacterium]|nr:S-methyl-5-thioribose-1-phosphate isomerase [Bacteroidales bacterium]